jgi:hypothetical protein
MMLGRSRTTGLALVAALGCAGACKSRKPAEINPIEPKISFNRTRVPLGSPLEITYTWTLDPSARKLPPEYRALVHFLDSHEVMLFEDDHTPTPPPSQWEPGKTYTYTRTKFVPIYPYVGEVEVRMGLYSHPGRGERVALKGEDAGMREYKVSKLELLPQTENIFLVYKDGWHAPEPHPENPAIERTWTKKEALVSFKNPKKDVVVYLEADTSPKFFPKPPVLTVAVGAKAGLVLPIEGSDVFLKKVRVKAEDLGNDDWVDLRLMMNQSFVPKLLTPPLNNDDRELGLLKYQLYVGEADKLGPLQGKEVVEAAPLPAEALKALAAARAPATKAAAAKAPAAKPAPAKKP